MAAFTPGVIEHFICCFGRFIGMENNRDFVLAVGMLWVLKLKSGWVNVNYGIKI